MKKSFSKKTLLAAAALVGSVCLLPAAAMAQVGGVCSNCHTMHGTDGAGASLGGVERALTKGGCVGCHSTSSTTGNSVSMGVGGERIPYILHTGGAGYDPTGASGDTLAGGDFYWVTQASGDAKGHNVEDVAASDDPLGNTPPGLNTTINAAYDTTKRLTCAGTNGCHGDGKDRLGVATIDSFADISGAHHGADAAITGADESTSFRFLMDASGNGILGLEDSDWEYQPTASAHNQYYGVDKANDSAAATGTISSLCAKCHGDFHTGDSNISSANNMASPWVRHPTDFDMNTATGSEYADYNVDNSYSVEAPVASTDVSAVKSAVMAAAILPGQSAEIMLPPMVSVWLLASTSTPMGLPPCSKA